MVLRQTYKLLLKGQRFINRMTYYKVDIIQTSENVYQQMCLMMHISKSISNFKAILFKIYLIAWCINHTQFRNYYVRLKVNYYKIYSVTFGGEVINFSDFWSWTEAIKSAR